MKRKIVFATALKKRIVNKNHDIKLKEEFIMKTIEIFDPAMCCSISKFII